VRKLLAAARGGGGYQPPASNNLIASGPYSSALTVSETVLTQVHCHTNKSDGSFSPAAVVADYLSAGYGALAITDHDKVTSQPAGITTAIPANELSPTQQHIIGINTTYTRGVTTDAQAIIDAIVADGGSAQIAHPKWVRGMTYAEMAALTGYAGMEIHNAKVVGGSGQNPITYPGYAMDRWDQLLAGRRDVWAFAVDDLHQIDAYNTYDIGRLQVFVQTNNVAGVAGRIASGNFVADVSNHGVTPGFPTRTNSSVGVTCSGATRIEAWGPSGILASASGTTLSYAYGAEPYVRLVAVGDYTEAFGSALSHLWIALDGTWAVSGGTLNHTGDVNIRRIILRRHREGDFTATVDAQHNGAGTDNAALMFNVLGSSYYYMVRFGASSVSGYNNRLSLAMTTSGSFPTTPPASVAFTAAAGTWYRIKLAYTSATGTITAKIWDRDDTEPADWQVTWADTTWRNGGFGFRANRNVKFDNLYIDGFRTYYQPIALDAA